MPPLSNTVERRWVWLFFEGLVSLGAAILTVMWPGITALAPVMLVTVGAKVAGTGIAEVVAVTATGFRAHDSATRERGALTGGTPAHA